MKRGVLPLSIILIALFCCGAQASAPYDGGRFPQRENTTRIMSFNIQHGRGMDGKVNIERIGKVILEVNPEVVGLQEVDSMINRSGNTDIIRMLSEQTGMYASFGYSILFNGGKYGNGVLTREKPVAVRKINLPGAEEARSALIVELKKYIVVNTHLSLTEEERVESVKIITEAVKDFDKPVFLVGDLNATPDSAPIQLLKTDWQILSDPKQHSYPSNNPNVTIDYILGYTANGETYAKYKAEVVNDPIASDHRPVYVDIRLKTPADQVMRTIPYLQNPGCDEMTIMWLTNVPAQGWVEFGTDSTNLQPVKNFLEGVMVANNKIHRVHLTGLHPGTKYYYRVVSQEITRYSSYYKEFGDTVRTELKSFTTWSDKQRDFRVIVYNDLHSNMAMFNKLHSLVEQKPYDLVIFNGDCFDDVEVEADIVNRLNSYTPRIKSDEVPSIFIRGNHETRGEYSLQLWNYLERINGRSYGAFSLGDTRFVLLDCGEDKPDDHPVYYGMNDFTQHRIDQADFLKEELKSVAFRKAKRRILIHHIPIFGVRADSFSPCSDLWVPVLRKAPFDISLNGHTHRFRVIDTGQAGNGFPVIIGGGNREPDGTVMILEKKGERLTVEVVNAAGKILLFRTI
jgi:endonuclease/exonuclease/phosphatase family metal-dependent hydrolase/Icc-related predicted phosphoesterase